MSSFSSLHLNRSCVIAASDESAPRLPPDVESLVYDLDGCFSVSHAGSCDQTRELTFVDMDTFLAHLNHRFLLVCSTPLLKIKTPILLP